MLLPTYFVIDLSKTRAIPAMQLPENGYFSYKVNNAVMFGDTEFYARLISARNNSSFCLYIDQNEELSQSEDAIESFFEALVPFTFHYKYIKRVYESPLIIFQTGRVNPEKYLQSARKVFQSHGYNNIEPVFFNPNDTTQDYNHTHVTFHSGAGTAGLSSLYTGLLKSPTSNYSQLFVLLENIELLPEIIDTLKQCEEALMIETPQMYCSLRENNIVLTKQYEVLLEKGVLEEQIESMNSYYLSGSSNNTYKRQVSQLLDFYKYEYEILPLWYKQFGHIVKVLMGKRTFKSLFNDNVKKYKR